MKENNILKRIDEIISISREKQLSPPVELVLTTDGNLISKDLYDEYNDLLSQKYAKKLYSEKDKIKYEQLMYLKDKMNFIQEKAKKSKNRIEILESDIDEYCECLKLYNDLNNELSSVLDYISEKQEQPLDEPKQEEKKQLEQPNIDESIENTITTSKKQFEKIEVDEQEIDNSLNNNKLLQDLADIDKILGNLNMNMVNDIKIGDIVMPLEDIASYNNDKIIVERRKKYKVISFAAIDSNNRVVNSSNLSDETLNRFSSQNSEHKILFVVSSIDNTNGKVVGTFDDITKFERIDTNEEK